MAIDINYAQHQQDAEGEFFRKIAEQGHYAGRTKPTATRQGLYIATADGNLLASVNTTSVIRVMATVNHAIEAWKETNPSSVNKFAETNQPDVRYGVEFPSGGLILRETMRDLPRANNSGHETWRHNFDHVWLTAIEVNSLVPKNSDVGQAFEIPEDVARRFAAYHLVDQVKGEADAWDRSDVQIAKMKAEVVENKDGKIKIKLSGSAKCVKSPTGEVNPFTKNKITKDRGVDLKIQGWLTYDENSKSFDRFNLLAAGQRWGTATYNFRSRDMGPAPIAFAFEMLPNAPENKTRPKFLMWNYFDK